MKFHRTLYQELVRSDRLPTPLRGCIKLASHWVFQGIRRMDTSERTFKLATTAVVSLVGYRLSGRPAVAVVLGHTANFAVNSHWVSALRSLNVTFYPDREAFDAYATDLLDSLSRRDWVQSVYVTGSVNHNRNEWHPGSDLDVVVVREPGLANGVVAAFGGLRLRLSAATDLFPLDVYVFDSEDTLDARLIDDREELVPYRETTE